MDKFDQMVETIEEVEDMVECKECFDLFPKAECLKAKMGYICPACGRAGMIYKAEGDPSRVQPNITTGLFDQEFPEVGDYDPGTVKDWRKESTLGDTLENTLAGLIDDEAKAAADYAETVEDVEEAEPENKEEVLNTLNHIKKEEEEHIEELKDLTNPESETEEDSVEESLTEDCTWVCKFKGQEIGTVTAKSEEEALEKMQKEYPEYPYGESDGCFEVCQEAECKTHDAVTHPEDDKKLLNESEEEPEEEQEDDASLTDAYLAALEVANEKGIGQVFGYATTDTEEFVPVDLFDVDDPEAVEDDLMAAYDDVAYAYVAYPEKNLYETLTEEAILVESNAKVLNKIFTKGYKVVGAKGAPTEFKDKVYNDYAIAEKAIKQISKKYPNILWAIVANGAASIPQRAIATEMAKLKYIIVTFKAGKEASSNLKTIAKLIKVNNKADRKLAKLDKQNERSNKVDDSLVDFPVDLGDLDDDFTDDDYPPAVDSSDEVLTGGEDTEDPLDEEESADDSADEELFDPEPEPEPETGDEDEPAKKTTANQKIKAALRSAGMSRADIDKLFKSGVIPMVRKALIGESLDEDFKDTEDAVAELKKTEATLKSAADGIKNMTSAMREEYHKYANPAELKVMEDLEAIVDAAKNDALHSMRNWGIDISESDSQGWMSGNNEYSYQFMLDYENIDEGEEEDIQDQLQNLVENAILSQYTLPPELSKISVSVALPDRDIAYEDEDGEELQDVKRASLFVDVTFARNLF